MPPIIDLAASVAPTEKDSQVFVHLSRAGLALRPATRHFVSFPHISNKLCLNMEFPVRVNERGRITPTLECPVVQLRIGTKLTDLGHPSDLSFAFSTALHATGG